MPTGCDHGPNQEALRFHVSRILLRVTLTLPTLDHEMEPCNLQAPSFTCPHGDDQALIHKEIFHDSRFGDSAMSLLDSLTLWYPKWSLATLAPSPLMTTSGDHSLRQKAFRNFAFQHSCDEGSRHSKLRSPKWSLAISSFP
jgi:hypothetical protein